MTENTQNTEQTRDRAGHAAEALRALAPVAPIPHHALVHALRLVAPDELEAAARLLLSTALANRQRAAQDPGAATPVDRAPRDAAGYVHAWSPATSMPLHELEEQTGVLWRDVLDSKGRYWRLNEKGDWWVEYDPANPGRLRYPGYATAEESEFAVIEAEAAGVPFLGDVESIDDLEAEAYPIYRIR